MRVFVSKPSIISSSGDEGELLENIANGKRSLKKKVFRDKEFMVGVIDDVNLDLNFIHKHNFATRTNAIALSAILPLQNQIDKLISKYGRENIGVIVASTTTGVEENYKIYKNGIFSIGEYDFAKSSLSNPAYFIKDFLNLNGICYGISTACTSGIKAINEAKNLVESGICKCVIVGGVDSLNTLTLFGFHSLSILSSKYCDPFSKDRDGTNLGEGAAFMVVGDSEVGDICIKSCVSNCDAFHMTSPRLDGYYQTKLIDNALLKANLDEVDYINLHATATLNNDMMESNALYSSKTNASCSGIKQYIGHCLGAAGIIESGVCALLLGKNKNLPLQIMDFGIDTNLKPINLILQKEQKDVKNAMCLSFAFGGDNACIILGENDD